MSICISDYTIGEGIHKGKVMITQTVVNIDFIVGAIFFMLYFYQIVFFLIPFIKKDKPHKETELHRYAVLISARNEENVIESLVNSIHHQDYNQELIDIYVIADNCTDNTADSAENAGATVFVRNDMKNVGKGYALDYAIKRIFGDKGEDFYDGFMVFDADNLLDTNFISAMNKTFSDGYKIVTSYRNSTNYGTNWITAGYALWYIRESAFLNHSRMLCGSGCAISGTGFLMHKDIVKELNGWGYYLLTEDIEFSIANAIKGERIAFCSEAILYDEQPRTFKQSWTQRLRWARGFLQVFGKYGGKLLKGIFTPKKTFKGARFTSFDMSMTVIPAVFMTMIIAIINAVAVIFALHNGENPLPMGISLAQWVCGVYFSLFCMGFVTVLSEHKRIHTSKWKKIKYLFTFPIFQFTYVPISIVAIFKKVRWEPTRHHGPSVSTEKIEQTRENPGF